MLGFEVVRNLTNNTKSNAVARDLALSPDKSQIAFFSGTGTGVPTEPGNDLALFVVRADGSQPGTQVPGAGRDANPGIGPRWAAGGTALTWGAVLLAGGQQLSIPAAGGAPRTIVATIAVLRTDEDGGVTSGEYHSPSGIGQGCGVSRGPLSIGFMAAYGGTSQHSSHAAEPDGEAMTAPAAAMLPCPAQAGGTAPPIPWARVGSTL